MYTETRGLNFVLSIHLLPYFVYTCTRSKGTSAMSSADAQGRLRISLPHTQNLVMFVNTGNVMIINKAFHILIICQTINLRVNEENSF